MKRLLFVSVLALACALVSGAAAATKASASKPKKTKKARCHIGQTTGCAPNPLFAKGACDALNAGLQAVAAPGVTVGKAYQPGDSVGSGLECFWQINGHRQAIWVHIYGGRNFSTTVEGDGGKVLTSPSGHTKWTLAEEFEWEYEQFFADPGSTCPIPSLAAASAGQPEPPWLNPVKTTIEGYEAWTQDDCAQLPQPDSPEYRPNFRIGRQVWVLDGDMTISLAMSVPDTTLDTSAQLIPFVEQIMRKYAPAK